MPKPLLKIEHVTKHFPGVVALSDVSLELNAGEVLSVIGENGAGKSTLMKILAGIQSPDAGQITLNGTTELIDSVQKATELGIALIHQELNLCENLSVAANIFLGREPQLARFLRKGNTNDIARKYLQKVGLDVDPDQLAGELSIGQQQLVEIAKALSINARIVIMDEPTSSLTQQETEYLYQIIEQLKNSGIAIIYISHRLAEVVELSDRVAVLRDGKYVGGLAASEITRPAMVSMMVGRDLESFYVHRDYQQQDVHLSVNDLQTTQFPNQRISFEVHRGEIVGIAGLVGSGRTEILTSIFGMTPPLGGTVSIDGQSIAMSNCRDSIANGIALVPEDRKLQGIVLEMAIRENVTMANLEELSWFNVFLSRKNENNIAEHNRQQLKVKTPSIETVVGSLSGGNQQKVVIGKWLANNPKILLLDEPTRGVDVGAKREIYELMDRLAQSGVSILFVSSEMEEVLGISDRILVMHNGELTGCLNKTDFSEENVMRLATGAQVHVQS